MITDQLKPNLVVRGPVFPEPLRVVVESSSEKADACSRLSRAKQMSCRYVWKVLQNGSAERLLRVLNQSIDLGTRRNWLLSNGGVMLADRQVALSW